MDVSLELFVKLEGLVLLLQELVFSHVGKEELFMNFFMVHVYFDDVLKQSSSLVVLAQIVEHIDEILREDWVSRLVLLELLNEVDGLRLSLGFHETESFHNPVEVDINVLLQSFRIKEPLAYSC